MAQYCRYCSFLVTGNGVYCTKLNKEISERAAKNTNKCKSFELDPTDAFWENEKGYMPRETARKGCDGQLSLF